jgi:two-component system, cell cycle response regulator
MKGRGCMKTELQERIHQCQSLPTLPAAALRVLDLSQKQDVGMEEFAAAIELDPALCSNLLRTVNSSFYGLSHRISNVRTAVAMLGIYSVKTLVLSISLGNVVNGSGSKSFNRVAYWRRCMYSAAAARVLAVRLLPSHVDDCFVAALLMDLGTLVLDQVLGQDYLPLHSRAQTHGDLLDIEQQALGINHAEAGAILARRWNLPELLAVPMAHHHRPESVESQALRAVTEVVSLAGRCADVFSTQRPAECIAIVRATLRERYEIPELECDALLAEVGQKTEQLAPLFDVALNSSSYDNILERASQRLLELSLGGGAAVALPQSPSNRRRAARMRRDGRITVIPCERGVLGTRTQVHLRDLSTCGLGFSATSAMKEGSQFVVELPAVTGGTKTLLYTVVRCRAEARGGFDIGAELTAILTPVSSPEANSN